MTIIEQIKAEIERRKRELDEQIVDIQDSKAVLRKDELQKLLSFLSTLESEKPMNLEEEVERYYLDNFDYISSDQPAFSILTNIARHFAKWGAEHLKK